MIVDIVFVAFAVCGLVIFRFCQPAVAVLVVFLGGWLVLPVGHYPAGVALVEFPYWITGLAVPSDMLLTKAWVAPVVALAGALLFDRRTLLALRPTWLDLPIALWCLWPLAQAALTDSPRPEGWVASAYLVGCWALPWCLGRAYFSSSASGVLLARGLVISALACLPFSLIEGVFGPVVYEAVYEPHPFRLDGSTRYWGFRPIGFFEHGNQFGLWLALCGLAAVWLARTAPMADLRRRRAAIAVAAVVVVTTLAAQSVGAIALMLLGGIVLWACRYIRPRHMASAVLVLLTLGGLVYVSGAVPVMKIGRETAFGQRAVEGLRAIGRGSFAWRISQDQKLLNDVMARPVVGQGRWDWWQAKHTRPWGFTLLALGQFGVVALCACLGALLWPALRVAWRAPRASGWQRGALSMLLASLVVLAVIDALMNSFIFFPAVLIAGALVAAPDAARAVRGEITRVGRVPQRE